MRKKKNKIIVAIAGEIASGKNTMAEYIERNCDGYSYRSSEVLRDILNRMYLPETRENMQKVSTMLREYFGEDVISFISALDLKKIKSNIIAINGVRRISDLECFKKDFKVKLIYIHSNLENRYQRICRRSENIDDKTKKFSDFKNDHKKETEKQIKNLRKEADYTIENDGTLEEFYRRIDKIIEIINK